MLTRLFENKRETNEAEVELEAGSFEQKEQNLQLIAITFLKQYLGIGIYTPDDRGVVRMHGGGPFADHRAAYIRELREKLSLSQSAQQVDAIQKAGGRAVEAMPFCPVPKYLAEYAAERENARRREEAKPPGLGKIGEIRHEVRR